MCLLIQMIPVQKWFAFFVDCLELKWSFFLFFYAFFGAMSWISLCQTFWGRMEEDFWMLVGWVHLRTERIWSSGAGLFQSGQVPGVSPPHPSTSLFLLVLLLHSTKGLIFCMIRPPPVLLLAPGPRLGSNTPSINTSKFLAESHQNETEKGE